MLRIGAAAAIVLAALFLGREARGQSFDAPLGEEAKPTTSLSLGSARRGPDLSGGAGVGRGLLDFMGMRNPSIHLTLSGGRVTASVTLPSVGDEVEGRSVPEFGEPEADVPPALAREVERAWAAAKDVVMGDPKRLDLVHSLGGGLFLQTIDAWTYEGKVLESRATGHGMVWGSGYPDPTPLPDWEPLPEDLPKLHALATAMWNVAQAMLDADEESTAKRITGVVHVTKDGVFVDGKRVRNEPFKSILAGLDGKVVTVLARQSKKGLHVVAVEGELASGEKVLIRGMDHGRFVLDAPREPGFEKFGARRTAGPDEAVTIAKEPVFAKVARRAVELWLSFMRSIFGPPAPDNVAWVDGLSTGPSSSKGIAPSLDGVK